MDVFGNRIGDEGARALAARLPMLPSLHVLVLDRNRVGDVGALAIAEALVRRDEPSSLSVSSPLWGAGGASRGGLLTRPLCLPIASAPFSRLPQHLYMSANALTTGGKAAVRAKLYAHGITIVDDPVLFQTSPKAKPFSSHRVAKRSCSRSLTLSL